MVGGALSGGASRGDAAPTKRCTSSWSYPRGWALPGGGDRSSDGAYMPPWAVQDEVVGVGRAPYRGESLAEDDVDVDVDAEADADADAEVPGPSAPPVSCSPS